MVLALASYSYLFNTPNDCIFLTPRERFISMERIRRDNQEDAAEKTKRKHIKRGILNINNIICALGFFFINVSAQSFSLFIPTILLAMGWTSTKAQLLTVPPYIVASIWCIVVCFLSDKVNKRGYFAIGNALCCGMGYAILVAAHSSNIKYMATFFCALGVYPLGPTFLSWGLISKPPSLPRHPWHH